MSISTSISETIIRKAIDKTPRKFICNFCSVDESMLDDDFVSTTRKKILKRQLLPRPLQNLANTPFTDLPPWLFQSQASTKYRQVRTVNGYSFDVAKSAMQKYARRGMPLECMYAMAEMNFFKWIDGGKGSFTNFYNRMRIILLEDVGIASPHAIPIANTLLITLKKTQDPFPMELPQLAWLLSNSLHYRMYSMIRAYYYKFRPAPMKSSLKFPTGLDEKEFGQDVNALVACLEKNDRACYWWMSLIVDSNKKLQQKRYNSTRSGFLGFAVLDWFLKKKTDVPKLVWDNFKICLSWYKDLKVKESSICPFHPMFMYIMRDQLVFDEPTYILPNSRKPTKYWSLNLQNKVINFIPPVYDMHTREGRNIGKDTINFASEGSLVGFENMTLDIPEARSEYVRAKIHAGTPQKESEMFVLKARAQLTCSQSRPDVYFASLGGKNVVVKGPYLDYGSANKSFQVSRLLSLFPKVNTVPTDMVLLLPDMFDNVPVGCRRQVRTDKLYYYLIFDDLYNLSDYPVKVKSSKLWINEKVVDFDTLFQNQNYGFAVPSEMSEKGRISLLYQLAIRYVFELGDFASRNFTRVGDTVWNLDTEGIFVGKSLRWKKPEREILVKTYLNNRHEIDRVLKSWREPVWEMNPSLYNRWTMVKEIMICSSDHINSAKTNLEYLINNYNLWLLS